MDAGEAAADDDDDDDADVEEDTSWASDPSVTPIAVDAEQ